MRVASRCFQEESYCEIQLGKSFEMDNHSVLVFGFLRRDVGQLREKLSSDLGQ